MYQYDYLIVGAGLYGAVMAHELHKKGKHCLVIDRRDHIAGSRPSARKGGVRTISATEVNSFLGIQRGL